MSTARKINPLAFYTEWAGHPVSDLVNVHSTIQTERPGKPIVYLAGDSSLDNKAWVPSSGPGGEPLPAAVPDHYSAFLTSLKPKPDVAFWLNHFLGHNATALNTAVEASLLRQRDATLLPHDEFIRDHIQPEDILIVSIGANDIALSPTASTMRHMFQLAWLTPLSSIERGTASSLAYFKHMFGDQTKNYIARLIKKRKPRVCVVCMIYYPLKAGAGVQPSWADTQLKALGYGRYPGQLQAAIKKMYEQATSTINIEGTTVVPCPLFETMDGKTKEDYTARVEPSVHGGEKMAAHLVRLLDGSLPSSDPTPVVGR
ncbi:hypothetical protein B0A55_10600 [Friedmanniomyces simplex]|uniref:SGNH hydrolase-type esterase domain-containing protein n=1 Tax=Friedmanniomyces simplex TaxID=329884 RepID=A0A4U0WPY0_9PEZI|nr:hypothetical protein B0A55_10600 [Friedmanniomyces simplex]